ncbi:ATP-dependent helicase [Campylobacter sp. LR264d]|uniref:ATP-dependent helicase n=1 Tax=Campylobacter sp. LR264d TaxID=2593544 RepID=UPI001239B5F1|nr:ATP-dependent helicase [Campylobacter sp. LR264d]KAA6233807.1 ATP-dependent helicase [Campylobacter sp. LR264d]
MPLSKLNDEQLRAATTPLGHNLIIASAGTGKTSTIVARIAFLLNKKIPADKIMLLTFTNKASGEMIARLNNYFSKEITSKIMAGTFHSIAYTLLKKIDKNISLKTAADLKLLLKSLCEKRSFSHLSELKPYQASYLYDIYSLFCNTAFDKDFKEWFCKNYEEQSVFAQIYEDIFLEYKGEKKRFNYLDFNDLLINLKNHLKENKYDFEEILVDEYQDTNSLQSSLIEAFESKSLFCVGDYDQSIYAFNGADISIIGSFDKRFKDAKIFSLNKNYRSTKSILALANKVIINNERLYPKELIVTREGEFKAPVLLSFSDNILQCKEIAKMIQTSGVSHNKIAVIFRNNSSADDIEIALRNLGIPSLRKDSRSFFDSLEIKAFCAMFCLLINNKDIMAFMHLMQYTAGVGSVLAKAIFDGLLKLGHGNLIKGFLEPDKDVNLQGTLQSNYDLGLFAGLDIFENETRFSLQSEFNKHPILKLSKINENCAKNLEQLFLYIKNGINQNNPLFLIELIYNNLFFKHICEILATKRATNKAGQVDILKKSENLEKIKAKLLILKNLSKDYTKADKYYNFLTLGASEISSGSGVNLLSVHASKGLEFSLVFVIDLAQGRFPNQKLISMGGSLEEERRLFYVAVTRAKDRLYLSYARYDNNKKTSFAPSCFLVEAGLSKGEFI